MGLVVASVVFVLIVGMGIGGATMHIATSINLQARCSSLNGGVKCIVLRIEAALWSAFATGEVPKTTEYGQTKKNLGYERLYQ